jgi:hypothetical protein
MAVAGRQFRPSVADADDGSSVEHMLRQTFGLHPTAVDESVAVFLSIAFGAAEPRLI